ncbi:LOW QUALITY PROTEIN: inter-alpha-trypsin inhibitor heavy chain H6, partial [Monodelphis domestica]|uniref:LOW QUALITY PROTEIN: inter-alpha-trypsin inhibitor heavy chain H6 n=1 Tax=Monodelphis domestica TaxID=13616 RepID=UPI0024E1DD6B
TLLAQRREAESMELLRVPGWLSFSLAISVALSFKQALGTFRACRELTVTSFSIHSAIVSRYSHTQVVSVMTNPHPEALEAVFDLDLPSLAFISNFAMTINGKVYPAEVKEKHQAKKMYEEARKQGQMATHVASRGDEVKKFRISTSVAGGGEVAFTLTYEELLPRLLGKYQHAVSVRPGQVVPNLRVEVTISERTGIDYIHVLPLQSSHLLTNIVRGEADLPTSTTIEKEKTCARVIFMPSPSEQAAYSSQGITGDFVIQYDVTMKDVIGDVQIYDGYFVHYFAPRDLPRLPKNIVFVIDVSGSMTGMKLKQTKKAMHVILGDLCPKDHFNIVTFSDTVHIWKAAGSIQAIPPNIQRAKAYVSRMKAARYKYMSSPFLLPLLWGLPRPQSVSDVNAMFTEDPRPVAARQMSLLKPCYPAPWTDMNAALLAAASILNQSIAGPLGEARLIIFLTDGEPTAGVTSPARILANAQRALAGQVALFGLALGDDADLPLLRRLSLENRGTAHRIREDHDAASQLKGFYDRIAYPLLSDIHLHYQARRAGGASPPWSHFPNYFKGSELVVVGQLAKREPELQVHLEAPGPYNHLFTAALREEAASGREPTFGCLSQGELALGQGFLPCLWAYVTIQRLLEGRLEANDSTHRSVLVEKALNLSLHFHFVTPLTSLVVVRPEEEDEGKQGPHASLTTTDYPVTTGKSPRPLILMGPTEPLLQEAKFTTTSPGPSSTAKVGTPRVTKQNLTPPIPWVNRAHGDPWSVKLRVPSFPKTGSLSPPRVGPTTHLSSVTPSLLTSSQTGTLLHAKPKSSPQYNSGSLAPPRSGFLTTPKPSTQIHPSPNILVALNGPLVSPSPPKAISPSLPRTGFMVHLKAGIPVSSSLQKQVSPGPPKTGSSSHPNDKTPNPNSSYFPKSNTLFSPKLGHLFFPRTRAPSSPKPNVLPQHNPSSPKSDTLCPYDSRFQFPPRPGTPDPPNLTYDPHKSGSSSPPKAQGLSQPNLSVPSQHTPPKWDLPASHSLRSPSLPRPATLFFQSVTTSPHMSLVWDSSTSSPPISVPHLSPKQECYHTPNLVLWPNLILTSSLPPDLVPSLSILSPPPPPYNLSTPEIIKVLVLPEEPGQLLETLPDSGFLESLKPPIIHTFPETQSQGSRRVSGPLLNSFTNSSCRAKSLGRSPTFKESKTESQRPSRGWAGLGLGMQDSPPRRQTGESDHPLPSSLKSPGIQDKPLKSPVVFAFSSSVDGDPHFEIQLPNSKSRICFTVDGRAGDTLQLIRDPVAGLQVSGHLLGAPPKAGHEHRTRTYFDRITVTVGRLQDPFIIHVSPHQVSLEMEGVTKRLSWDQPLLILQHRPGLELILQHKSTLTIRLSLHLEFLIRRHRDRHPTPLRLPHLGFYIVSGQGLSQSAQGILGQFQYLDLLVKQTVSGAWLERPQGPSVPLVSTSPDRDLLSRAPCWRVKHQDVEKLLGSPYRAFVL